MSKTLNTIIGAGGEARGTYYDKLFDAVTEMLNLTKEQLEALAESFLSRLPVYLRNSLTITVN